jgi:hypothetical protein
MLLYFFLSIFVAMFLFTYFALRDTVKEFMQISRDKKRSYDEAIPYLIISLVHVLLWLILTTTEFFHKGFYVMTHPFS